MTKSLPRDELAVEIINKTTERVNGTNETLYFHQAIVSHSGISPVIRNASK